MGGIGLSAIAAGVLFYARLPRLMRAPATAGRGGGGGPKGRKGLLLSTHACMTLLEPRIEVGRGCRASCAKLSHHCWGGGLLLLLLLLLLKWRSLLVGLLKTRGGSSCLVAGVRSGPILLALRVADSFLIAPPHNLPCPALPSVNKHVTARNVFVFSFFSRFLFGLPKPCPATPRTTLPVPTLPITNDRSSSMALRSSA